MLYYQNSPGMNKELAKVGCAFMCPLFFRAIYQKQPMHKADINKTWEEARRIGIINPSDHKTNPLEIADWQRLLNLQGVKLRVLEYVPGNTHWPVSTPVSAGHFGIYAWYNPRTKFTHFVVGKSRPVEYDPIAGGSITVREGAPKADGLRLFEVVV